MASEYLKNKAKQAAERVTKEYGENAYGGTKWLNSNTSAGKTTSSTSKTTSNGSSSLGSRNAGQQNSGLSRNGYDSSVRNSYKARNNGSSSLGSLNVGQRSSGLSRDEYDSSRRQSYGARTYDEDTINGRNLTRAQNTAEAYAAASEYNANRTTYATNKAKTVLELMNQYEDALNSLKADYDRNPTESTYKTYQNEAQKYNELVKEYNRTVGKAQDSYDSYDKNYNKYADALQKYYDAYDEYEAKSSDNILNSVNSVLSGETDGNAASTSNTSTLTPYEKFLTQAENRNTYMSRDAIGNVEAVLSGKVDLNGLTTTSDLSAISSDFAQIDAEYKKYASKEKLTSQDKSAINSITEDLISRYIDGKDSSTTEYQMAREYQLLLNKLSLSNSPVTYLGGQFALGMASTIPTMLGGLSAMAGDIASGGQTTDNYTVLEEYLDSRPNLKQQIALGASSSGTQTQSAYEQVSRETGVPVSDIKSYGWSIQNEYLQEENASSMGRGLSDTFKTVAGSSVYSVGQNVYRMLLTMGAPASEAGGLIGKLIDGAKSGETGVIKNAIKAALKGNVSTYYMAADVLSSQYGQDAREGKKPTASILNSLGHAFCEYFTEGLFGFSDMASITNALEKVSGSTAGTIFKGLLSYGLNGAEEGLEEFVNAPMGNLVDRMTDHQYSKLVGEGGIFDISEMLENGITGMVSGFLLGSVGAISTIHASLTESRDISTAVKELNKVAEGLPAEYRPPVLDPNTATMDDAMEYEVQLIVMLDNYQKEKAQNETIDSTIEEHMAEAEAEEADQTAVNSVTQGQDLGATVAAETVSGEDTNNGFNEWLTQVGSTLGKNGQENLQAGYIGGDVEQYAGEFLTYYAAGYANEDIVDTIDAQEGNVTMNGTQIQLAYEAGVADRMADDAKGGSTSSSEIATASLMDAETSDYTNNTEAVTNGTEQQAGRQAQQQQQLVASEYGQNSAGGQERTDSVDSVGQSSTVAAGTSQTASGRPGSSKTGRSARRSSYESSDGRVSTSADIGMANGTNDSVLVISDEALRAKDEDTYNVKRTLEGMGVRVTVVSGNLHSVSTQTGEVVASRGAFQTDEDGLPHIFIQADNKNLDGRTIAKHELFHLLCKRAPALKNRVRDSILKEHSTAELRAMVKNYAWLYFSGEEITPELTRYILEEIYADAYAGIDVFKNVGLDYFEGATKFSKGVYENVSDFDEMAPAGETREGVRKEGRASGEGRLSYDYSKPFDEQVDDWIAGKIPKYDTLVIGATPKAFRKVGFNALPMTINQSHVDYAINGTKNEDHHIGETLLKQLPSALANPVAIIASETEKSTSVVALLPFTHNGNTIVAPVYVDGYGIQNAVKIDSNAVTSIYGRRNAVTSLLTKALNGHKATDPHVFYLDKAKATALYQSSKVTMPKMSNISDGFVASIRDNGSPVKLKINNVTESQQFKRWFGKSKVVNEDGTPRIVYHQTDRDFTVFNTNNPVAGANDSETPNGIFFKQNDHDIGVGGDYVKTGRGGDIQMAAYLRVENPLHFEDRKEANAWYVANVEGYDVLQEKMKDAIAPLDEEFETLENAFYMDESISEEEFDNKWNKLMDELRKVENGYRGQLRELLNDYFLTGKSGYDGIEIDDDGHRYINGKREDVHTYIVFDSTQVKSATDNIGTFDSSNPDIRYSLEPVEPIQPKSKAWERSSTTDEVRAVHPTLWAVDAESSEERNPTQIKGTVKSYRKIYDALKAEGFDGTILDASSGLGYGTQAGIEEYGFNVEDIEPYPGKSYNPKYTDYSKLNKKYDVIISNAVLNVLPQDQRDALTVKMGQMLNDGGRMFVNVRGTDVRNASSKVAIDDANMEYFISNTGSYQKGFTRNELVAYLRDALGAGYTVETTNKFGAVSAIVTKSTEGTRLSQETDEEYLTAVRSKDMTTAQKMVDERAKQWGAMQNGYDGGYYFYHGTNSDEFTIFDKSEIGSANDDGYFGRGFYFAFTRDEARYYGRNVKKAFLRITNPFDFQKELYTLDGARTSSRQDVPFIINFAEKFPKLAERFTVSYAEKDSDNVKEMSYAEFSEIFRKYYNSVDFKVEQLGNEDNEYVVLADKYTETFEDYDGKKHTFTDYRFKQRTYGLDAAKDKIAMTMEYLDKIVYGYLNTNIYGMDNGTTVILGSPEFSDELRKMGHDGIIQSEQGDEAVVFDSEQIKSADPVTYDDDGNVIPLSQRFNSRVQDIRFSQETELTDEQRANIIKVNDTSTGDINPASGDIRFSLIENENITKRTMAYFNNPKNNVTHITEAEMKRANRIVDEMVAYMKPWLDAVNQKGGRYLPEEILGDTRFENGSYGRSIENTTICFRTLAYIDFTNAIKEELGRPLTVEESFLASQMLYDIAKEPQCLYCYVSLDRKAYDESLLKYIDQRDSTIKKFNALSDSEKEATLQRIDEYEDFRDEVGAKYTAKLDEIDETQYDTKQEFKDAKAGIKKQWTKELEDYLKADAKRDPLFKKFLNRRKATTNMRERFDAWITYSVNGDQLIGLADLTTEEKRSHIKAEEGVMADQIRDAEAYAQSASWAKKLEQYRSYNGEILTMTEDLVDTLNKEYGLRFYSFSEYTPAFIAENMQQIRDAAVKGFYGLAYTKKPDFARIFAPTGMNINISVFARMDGDKIVPDTLQGADWNEVKELRAKYDNVGAVFVATTDKMVDWALEQDWIDVVIPFHIVRTGANVAEFYGWVNHTSQQADKTKGKGGKGGAKADITPSEHNNDFETYKSLIEERNLIPRFKKWYDKVGKGLGAENYMKLVNETRRSASESVKLKPNYDENVLNEAKRSFDQFVRDGGYYGGWYEEGVDYNEAVNTVVSDIRSGRRANEVSYGRQDFDATTAMTNRKNRANRVHGQMLSREVTNPEVLELMKKTNALEKKVEYWKEQAANSREQAKELEKQAAASAKEAESSRQKAEYWEKQTKVSEKPSVDQKSLSKATTAVMAVNCTAYVLGTDADRKEVRQRLEDLYNFIEQGGDEEDELTWTGVWNWAVDIARYISRYSYQLTGEEERVTKARRYLKQHKFYVDPADAPADFSDWRNRHFGTINVAKGKAPGRISIDSVWGEMQDIFGEGFAPDTEPAPLDQLEHVLDELSKLETSYLTSADQAYLTNALANTILDEYYNVKEERTYADRMTRKLNEQKIKNSELKAEEREKRERAVAKEREKGKAKLTEQKAKDKAKLEKAIADKHEALEKQREENRASIEALRKRINDNHEKQMQELKQRYADAETKRRERQEQRKLRERINKRTKELSDMLLKPTDKKHIPQRLQSAVANLLESVNLESAWSYGEDGKLQRKPDGAPVKRTQAFVLLRDLYKEIGSELVIDPDLLGDKDTKGLLDDCIALRDVRIDDMNVTQLSTVLKAVQAIGATIRTSNKMFNSARWATVHDAAARLQADNANKRMPVELRGFAGRLVTWETLGNLTPDVYMSMLGKTGEELFRVMRDAQDKQTTLIAEAAKFTESLGIKDARKWEQEIHPVTLGGQQVELSTAQIMALYVLSRRDQGTQHIYAGGILPETIQKKGALRNTNVADPIRGITPAELNDAFSILTIEQRTAANSMQDFLSKQVADWGNEASMAVYGYKKFGEEHYWPIHAQEIAKTVENHNRVASVSNKGFTKAVEPKATNSLKISSIFDDFSGHIQEMATYAAWLETSEDLRRIRNYIFRDEEGNRLGTIEGTLKRVHGSRGAAYWDQLQSDIALGTDPDRAGAGLTGGLTGRFKAAAVGGNIRVIIQQPTAIFRALDMISPAYLMRPSNVMKGWEKARKYAPIALWKDWGYFEISTGKRMKDVMFKSETTLDKLQQASMWGAGMADSIAWGQLWNACEAETKAKKKDLKPGTKDYYDVVAKRFTEIVDRTQVVDGILQRSQNMRSRNELNKMASSFMAEPTKQLNMVMLAAYNLKHSTKGTRASALGHMARTATALTISGVINAVAQSIVDAWRDDDRDKDYIERWLESFWGFTGDEESAKDYWESFWDGNVENPLIITNYLPYMQDVVNLLQGYDVERMDMSIISDFISAGTTFVKALKGTNKYTVQGAATDLLTTSSKLLGLPLATLERDVKGILNTYATEASNYVLQYHLDKFWYKTEGEGANRTTFMDTLYRAYTSDGGQYRQIWQDMRANGVTLEQARSAMESRMVTDQGVDGATDLAQRWISPDNTEKYAGYVDELNGNGIYRTMSGEDQKSCRDLIYKYLTEIEKRDVGETEDYKVSDATTKALEMQEHGITFAEYAIFKVSTGDLESDKDEEGKTISGSLKEKRADVVEDMDFLTSNQKDYLFSQWYTNLEDLPW